MTQALAAFLGAVAAQFHLRRLLLSKWKPPVASEIDRHVKAAVSMFLKEFGPR